MSEYYAPLKEMQFVLNELVGLTDICQLPGFEDASADVISAVLDEAAKLAGGVLSPLNVIGDQLGSQVVDGQVIPADGFKAAYQQFVDGGWPAVSASAEFGGMGLPDTVGSAVAEMWSGANPSFSLCALLTQGAIGAIKSHGSDALKQRYLTKLVTGEWTGTMNLTESQAGSDLAAVRTKAVPEKDRYRIFGTKIFITWGDHDMTDNIVHLVLARTPDAPEGVKGISLFVVPKYIVNEDGSLGDRNDAFAVSVEHKMGIHASPTCVMSFGETQAVEGANGAIGYLVGEENKGLSYMFTMMNHARLGVGIQGVALSDAAYQHAVGYARERIQGRTPGDAELSGIIRHPDVRRMLMLMRTLTEAGRAINYLAIASYDQAKHGTDDSAKVGAQGRVELLTPIAKGWATEVAQEVTSLGVQVHGGMGFIEETGAAQYMRDARITTIYEGTTGIQANDLIGRKLIRDNGQQMQSLLLEMRATQTQLMQAGDRFKLQADALAEGIEQLDNVCQWVLASYQQDARLPGAASFNLLMLAGTVVGGWLMSKSALVANQKQTEDQDFYKAKLLTAQFYAEQVMPRAISYARAAKVGTQTLMSMSDQMF